MPIRLPVPLAALLGATLICAGCGSSGPGDRAAAPGASAPLAPTSAAPTSAAPSVTPSFATSSGSAGSPSLSSSGPLPSSSAASPPSTGLTLPGSVLTVGQPAVVRSETLDEKALLQVTPRSVKQGTLDDFEGFRLDATAKASTPYYVTVNYRHEGGTTLRYPFLNVKLSATDASGDEAQKLIVSGLAACPSGDKAAAFKKGDEQTECSVFLVPKGGTLGAVLYEPDFRSKPVTWRVP